MKAGDVIKFRSLRQTAAGAAAVGLLVGDFTFSYVVENGSVAFVPSVFTEGATLGPVGNEWREYFITGTLSPTVGVHDLRVFADNTDVIANSNPLYADLGAFDIDLLAASVIQPVVTLTDQGGPTGDVLIRIPKDDYAEVTFAVQDQAGNPIDLTSDDTPHFCVENKTQTISPTFDQTTGITLGNGTVTIAIPENSTFYDELATGVDQVTLFWSLISNKGADPVKTRTVARGRLVVVRRECV